MPRERMKSIGSWSFLLLLHDLHNNCRLDRKFEPPFDSAMI